MSLSIYTLLCLQKADFKKLKAIMQLLYQCSSKPHITVGQHSSCISRIIYTNNRNHHSKQRHTRSILKTLRIPLNYLHAVPSNSIQFAGIYFRSIGSSSNSIMTATTITKQASKQTTKQNFFNYLERISVLYCITIP